MRKPVIGASNQKGGVGKTTTIKILIEYFSKYLNKKTLVLDLDPQFSLSLRYLGNHRDPVSDTRVPPIHPIYDPQDEDFKNWDGRSSIADIFYSKPIYPYNTRIPNLHIAPSDEAKLSYTYGLKQLKDIEIIHNRINEFLSLPDVQSEYDLFAIDTPPAKESLTISAFKAMTHLIIPLEMEAQAIEGLQGILTLWRQESLQRPPDFPLKLIGVLASKFHNRRSNDKRKYESLVKSLGEEFVIPIKICDRTQYPEIDDHEMSIFDLSDNDDAKKECLALGEFVAKRVFG